MRRNQQVVFLEKDKDIVDNLISDKFSVLDVGPIDEHVLFKAGIKRASGLVACLGDDSKNLLVVLTAKEINPDILIAARASDMKMVKRLKRAGADLIILPEAVGGVKLADALLGFLSPDVISK